MEKLKHDEQFIDEIRQNHIALQSNHNQVYSYQLNREEKFLEMAENRGEKTIPFKDSQIDAGNGSSVYGSGEAVNVCQ